GVAVGLDHPAVVDDAAVAGHGGDEHRVALGHPDGDLVFAGGGDLLDVGVLVGLVGALGGVPLHAPHRVVGGDRGAVAEGGVRVQLEDDGVVALPFGGGGQVRFGAQLRGDPHQPLADVGQHRVLLGSALGDQVEGGGLLGQHPGHLVQPGGGRRGGRGEVERRARGGGRAAAGGGGEQQPGRRDRRQGPAASVVHGPLQGGVVCTGDAAP